MIWLINKHGISFKRLLNQNRSGFVAMQPIPETGLTVLFEPNEPSVECVSSYFCDCI